MCSPDEQLHRFVHFSRKTQRKATMKPFRDNEGRPWTLDVNVYSIDRVRDLCQVDLCGVVGEGAKEFAAVLDDPIRFAFVLWAMVQGEAETKNVSQESFFKALKGDPLQDAQDALIEELIAFFPKRAVREGLTALFQKSMELAENLGNRAKRQAAELDIEAMAESLAQKFVSSSTGAPASLESTPDVLPFAAS
jgi:hypothetical protein